MIKEGGVEFATFPSPWEARACSLDQYGIKQENVDQIQAGNVIKRVGLALTKKYKNIEPAASLIYLCVSTKRQSIHVTQSF
jgi:hypothetical protein